MWLFATRFDVPATKSGSENAIRGYKLTAKISGCWRTLATLQRHCRIRSYLTAVRSHGRHRLAAIRDALTGNCWMPRTQHVLTRHLMLRLVKVYGQILGGHQRLENLARRRRTSRLSAPAHDPAPVARTASGHGRSWMSGSGADLPCRRSLEPLANAERISP